MTSKFNKALTQMILLNINKTTYKDHVYNVERGELDLVQSLFIGCTN